MRVHIFQILKAVLAAVLFSLAFVLIFTVIIQLFNLPAQVIRPVNQIFKILAIVCGGLIFIRGEKGLLKGAIYGVSAVLITFLLFGLISMSLSFTWKTAVELLIGAAAGAITGVIAVNLKSKT